ncbi:hypothetical protein [Solibacillus sp. FSL W7-1324]
MNQFVMDRDIKTARKVHSMVFIEREPVVIYAPGGIALISIRTGIEVI